MCAQTCALQLTFIKEDKGFTPSPDEYIQCKCYGKVVLGLEYFSTEINFQDIIEVTPLKGWYFVQAKCKTPS